MGSDEFVPVQIGVALGVVWVGFSFGSVAGDFAFRIWGPA